MRLIFGIVKQLTKITNNSYDKHKQLSFDTYTFYLLMQWSENFAFDLNTEESIFSKYFNYSLAFIKNYPLLQLSRKLEVPFIFLYQDLQVCRFDYCVLASYFVHCLVLPQLRSSYAHSQ